MMEENKYLKLARVAREENNAEDAKKYYEMAYVEQPDCAESKWYYAYYSLMDCANKDIADKFCKLCNSLIPTLKLVAMIEDEEQKNQLGKNIIDSFMPLKNAMIDAISNVTVNGKMVLPFSHIDMVKKEGNETLRKLGDEVINIFGEKEPYISWALYVWKRNIDERHALPYRNYQDKGKELWFDVMGKKIQKYEPSYKMPEFKQNGGCVSGNAAYVKPGE